MASTGSVTVIVLFGIALSIVSSLYVVSYTHDNSLSTSLTQALSQITYMQDHPSTTTVHLTSTQTVISTLTIVSTSTAYPIPDNVTVYFSGNGVSYNYQITAGSINYNGGTNKDLNFPITPVYQGEAISISDSIAAGFGGCIGGQAINVQLYVNGSMVSQSSQVCGSNGASISYVL